MKDLEEKQPTGHHLAIETHDLTKKYGELVAVDSINLSVGYGEIFGILGPNGAGKTTLISMLCTIINPTSGKAKVNGFDILREQKQVRESIGIVFQEPSLDDKLTGRENLEFHAMIYNIPKKIRKQRIEEVLCLVDLEKRADRLVRTYSGGMRRRLEIARGFIHHPKIYFLDEPTLGLDLPTRMHIWEYIKNLRKREEITIVLITNYMEEADYLCGRVAIMDFGKINAVGSLVELKGVFGGSVIEVKTDRPQELISNLNQKISIIKSQVSDKILNISVKDGERIIPILVEIASANGIPVEAVTLHEPTLNDVFFHYTGRELRSEQEAPKIL